MYVCVCIYIYIYIYACIHLYMHVILHANVQRITINLCTKIHINTHTCRLSYTQIDSAVPEIYVSVKARPADSIYIHSEVNYVSERKGGPGITHNGHSSDEDAEDSEHVEFDHERTSHVGDNRSGHVGRSANRGVGDALERASSSHLNSSADAGMVESMREVSEEPGAAGECACACVYVCLCVCVYVRFSCRCQWHWHGGVDA